jgi:hypothetical protein
MAARDTSLRKSASRARVSLLSSVWICPTFCDGFLNQEITYHLIIGKWNAFVSIAWGIVANK